MAGQWFQRTIARVSVKFVISLLPKALEVCLQLRVMVNSASLLTTMLFALGNLLGQNLGNHDAAWSNYYGVFLAVSQCPAEMPSCLDFVYI